MRGVLSFEREKKRRQASSPHVPLTHNKVLLMDYSASIRAVIASFYVGTGGLDVGLTNACQGIAGGKNWEQTFSTHQKIVCEAILKVVDACFADNLKEEIELTKKEVGHEKVSVSYDMGW